MKRAIFTLFLVLFFAPQANSSYISLPTTVIADVNGNALNIMMSTINNGDEPAYNVRFEAKAQNKTFLSEKNPELGLKETYITNFETKISSKKPGTYPIITTTYYTDANQYPFSALNCQIFTYIKDAPSPVFGKIKPVSIIKEGELNLIAKNLSSEDLKVKIKYAVPRELTIISSDDYIFIPKLSEVNIKAKINNFSALQGSTYQIYAVFESEDKDSHYTAIIPGTIKVSAAKDAIGLDSSILLYALIGIIIIFIGAQFLLKNK